MISFSAENLVNIKGIIFDFDGTLFDKSLIALRLIAACPVDAVFLLMERLVRKQFAGKDYYCADDYHRAFFTELGKACLRSPEKMKLWYFNSFMPRMTGVLKKHYRARHGTDELLQRCVNNSIKIAVYSDYPLLKDRFHALGLTYQNDIRLYDTETFGAQKPAVRPFLHIANDFGLPCEEILVVGDREETDGIGAANAGMSFFFLKSSRDWERLYTLLMEKLATINS